MRRAVGRLLLASCIWALAAGTAGAAELTDIASSFEPGNRFDLRLFASYSRLEKRALVQRELEAAGQSDIRLIHDLTYAQRRDSVRPGFALGLYRDLELRASLPLVIDDRRELGFYQPLGSACRFPGDPGGPPSCINAQNSSTIADGIVPVGGIDASAAGATLPPGSPLLFRGPRRGGSGRDLLDTVDVSLTWRILSQRRDDTKPDWTLGVEGLISVGTVMRFDRAAPLANRGVSEGVHRIGVHTAISHRFRYVDPYFGVWYRYPIARKDSLFIDYGPAQQTKRPQQTAGAVFGLELVPLDRPRRALKLALQFQGRLEARFEGRGYSEVWELLAGSNALACDPARNSACDPAATPRPNAYQNQPYTGLTTIDQYLSVGGDFALVFQAGRYLRLRVGLRYTRDQGHFVTADDLGQPLDPSCEKPVPGRVVRPCEFNPAYRPVVNQVGRRYRVDGVNLFDIGAAAQVMF